MDASLKRSKHDPEIPIKKDCLELNMKSDDLHKDKIKEKSKFTLL